MTKQLKDLFQQFSTQETSVQLERIKEIRHHRSIERPAAAVKRVKKEKKQSEKRKTNLLDLVKKMDPAMRLALISKLKAEQDEKAARDNEQRPVTSSKLGTPEDSDPVSGGPDENAGGGSS